MIPVLLEVVELIQKCVHNGLVRWGKVVATEAVPSEWQQPS